MGVVQRRGIGSQTRRRIVDVRVAIAVATIDALTVGSWFVLVALEPRTTFTALSGLVVLTFGAIVRTGLVSFTLSRSGVEPSPPQRLASGVLFAGAWVSWLLVAESIGSRRGIAVAGLLFVCVLLVHFGVQWWSLARRPGARKNRHPAAKSLAIAAALLATSASVMLAVAWYADLVLAATTVPLWSGSVTLEIPTVLAGIVALAGCSVIGTLQLLSARRDLV